MTVVDTYAVLVWMADLLQVSVGRRDKLRVFGDGYDTTDGTGIRDYIHVMDVAEGHSAALEHILSPECVGAKVFNLGTGGGHSVMEVLRAFEKVRGKNTHPT